MDKIGRVIATADGVAKVAVHRTSGCKGGCKTCSGCDTPEMLVYLPNEISAMPGDTVEIVANNYRVLKYTIILYSIPLLSFILGIALSIGWFQSRSIDNYELYGFLIGVLCFALSLLILRVIDRKLGSQDADMMRMSRVIDRL